MQTFTTFDLKKKKTTNLFSLSIYPTFEPKCEVENSQAQYDSNAFRSCILTKFENMIMILYTCIFVHERIGSYIFIWPTGLKLKIQFYYFLYYPNT